MQLDEYFESLAYDAAFSMAGVMDRKYPLEQLGALTLEVTEKLRSLGIIALLVHGDSDSYYHNLIRGALSWERYLRRCRDEQLLEDHHRASGRYMPLMDALAAGEFELAQRIAELSPDEWREGHEYEDDYCYAKILQYLIQDSLQENGALSFLKQFEVYLEGEPSARYDICRALIEGEQDAFDEAFEALLDEREDEITADKERGQMEEPEVISERRIFIEGLALLRIAEKRGLETQQDYRYCPSLARVPMGTPFPGE